MPMNDLEVELINSNNQIWQLTQTNSNAKIKTYFRFANKYELVDSISNWWICKTFCFFFVEMQIYLWKQSTIV